MFAPVGSQPPSVYWRRRLLVLGGAAVLVLLIVLTVRVVAGGSSGGALAGASGPSSPSTSTPALAAVPSSAVPSSAVPSSAVAASASTSSRARVSATQRSSSQPSSSTAVPPRCVRTDLAVQAVPGQPKYQVGEQAVMSLQVTNNGAQPCVQNLADSQVMLNIYNGESRVWGSHDCEIQPGTTDRVLPTGQAVRVSVAWSGHTSQQGCTGTRQRVGAGTYTLYAQLSGASGKAARFTIG